MRDVRGGVTADGRSIWIAIYRDGELEDGLMASVEEAQVVVAKMVSGLREIKAAEELSKPRGTA